MLMVIAFVFLHLPVHQMKTEGIQCPSVCQCSNKTVATCKDLKIDGINMTSEWKFGPEIEILDISGNKLNLSGDTLNEWNVLKLRSFNLSGNILNFTKITFAGLSNLEDLDLSDNNISSIDCNAFSLTPSMAFLRLRSNRLTEICPHTFVLLENLRHLDLSNNMLTYIQLETFDNSSVLEWLSLANNKLSEIHPDTLGLLCHLRHLDLSNNMISSIQLKTLYNNSVLEWLSLANNKLTKIHPDTLELLCHLRHLDLSNNVMSSIQPGTLCSSSVLEWLSLANNKLTEIHPNTLGLLCHLRHLDLSNNLMTSIQPGTLCSSSVLEWLSLANNRLTEIYPDTFSPLAHLQHLDLSKNMISSIQQETYHKNFVLELPSLSNNELNEIHLHIFYNQRKLSCLDLSRNIITKIEGTLFYCNREIDTLLLTSKRNLECIASDSPNQSELNTSEINEYHLANLTSIILRKLELSELRESKLSVSDESSGNVLNTSGALINLTGNPHTYECSLCQDIYENITVTSLNCFSQGDSSTEKSNNSENNDCSTTMESLSSSVDGNVNSTDKNLESPTPPLPEIVLIFGIYASSVFVAIVVVLVITHVVGKPELDEFWWEDKLAKRSY